MPPGVDIPGPLLDQLALAFGRRPAPQDLIPLKVGGYGNANVYRLEIGGQAWVIKEFHSRPWLLRHTLGRFLIRREARVLAHLDGIAGVPGGGRRLGPVALAEAFIEGDTLVDWHREKRGKLPKAFFLDMERLVADMHRAGYAHLDLRNLRNIICARDGHPYFLDFQSSIRTAFCPGWVRRIMENTDRSSVCKAWLKLCAEPLDPGRAALLQRFNGIRKLWVFEGYWLAKRQKNWSAQRRTPAP